MPTTAVVLTPEGIEPTAYKSDSLRQLAQQEPQGVYTITRTYQTDKAVLLEAHFDRLEESARLEGIEVDLNRGQLRRGLRQLITRAGYAESRLRITIPRDKARQPLLAAEPLSPVPASFKSQGVAAATATIERENPRAKSNAWEAIRSKARRRLPDGIYEGLLVDRQGRILEGFASNFYAILDGVLHTAEKGILQGISRKILLEVLPPNLEFVAEPVRIEQLSQVDEAFMTSSSRGVLPIVKIDGGQIGPGTPGQTTQELRQRYDDWVLAHLEPI